MIDCDEMSKQEAAFDAEWALGEYENPDNGCAN